MIDAAYVKRLATQTTLDMWPGWVHEGRPLENLIAFARAVAAAEREACATVVFLTRLESEEDDAPDHGIGNWLLDLEDAIRKRSND